MGDIDWYLRQRFNVDSQDQDQKTPNMLFYLRDPALSDEDNL